MKFCILCQEEPIFLGPMLQRVMELHPDRVTAVFVAGRRSAGEQTRTLRERLDSLRIFWNIFEPRDFSGAAFLRARARLLGPHDPRSIAGAARRLGIPVHRVADPRSLEFRSQLRQLQPDVVLNQAELLLDKDMLKIPRIGFINRHASLLPSYRGRMGAFWSHAAEQPRYGVTIHFVDEGIDTGPIILQREFNDILPSWPYPRVMCRLCADASVMIWDALGLLESPGFMPAPNPPSDKPFLFPTLAQANEYRLRLRDRRSRRKK